MIFVMLPTASGATIKVNVLSADLDSLLIIPKPVLVAKLPIVRHALELDLVLLVFLVLDLLQEEHAVPAELMTAVFVMEPLPFALLVNLAILSRMDSASTAVLLTAIAAVQLEFVLTAVK